MGENTRLTSANQKEESVLTLTPQAFQQTRSYIQTHGRPVDARLFEFHFEGGAADAVLAELAPYQNEDGGFGHGLEPDLRTAASSAIATQQAFHIFSQIDAPPSEPMVQRAVAYLLNTFEMENAVWPIVPPAVEDAPHAPWWTYAKSFENFGGFLINPRAALVGYLHRYASLVPQPFLDGLRTIVVEHLESLATPMEMHDLFCCATLASGPNLPEADRARVLDVLRRTVQASVATDPATWGDYVLTPLDVAPTPDAPLAASVPADAVAAQLDAWIEQQLPDGSWPLPWSWAFVDAEAWAQAERDWKGHLAVTKLNVLRAHGRMEV